MPDADVLTDDDPEHPGWTVMLQVGGDEKIEIDRWSRKRYPHGPAAVIRSLGQLQRGYRQR